MAQDPIAVIRQKIAALKSERARTVSAPIPLDAALQRVRSAVEHAAAARLPLSLRSFTVAGERGAIDLGGEIARRPTGLLAWLLGDVLVARLEAELRAVYAQSDVQPRPEAGRSEALAKIDKQISAAEIEEERLIRQAERAGGWVDRREDANPAAVLAVLEEN